MKKQSSSRSQRGSRGIKGKHVVQICVLLGVCIWLIYQVKYSHDKKKFYEADGKKSTVLLESEERMVKLGRKDLLPGYHSKEEKEKHVEEEEDEEEEEEKESKSNVENNSTHEEEEKEDEEDEEEDKNKQGEEVVEEDEEENKHEEEDDIDEQDQSKDDELSREEKENGSSEKETETNHADEIDTTVHEAREEHYKADDASSAVSHESRILNTESFGNSTGPSQENSSNATISEVDIQKEPVLKLGEAVEKTTTEVKEGDSESSNSESAVTELRGETVNGNSTEAVLEASGFLHNETRTMQERSQEHDKTEDGAPPSGSSDLKNVVELEQSRNETDANVTVSANITNTSSIQDESRNSTLKPSLTENISGPNTTEVKESSRYEGDDDETEEKESSDHFATEQTEEADDTPESTMLQEEREALTDPQTLPDISIEGKEEEDEEEAMAAE